MIFRLWLWVFARGLGLRHFAPWRISLIYETDARIFGNEGGSSNTHEHAQSRKQKLGKLK